MPQIQAVLKAVDYDPAIHDAMLPLYATPKVDGIRFYIAKGVVWAGSNKPHPNIKIQKLLPKILPDGMDGELVIGDPTDPDHFQNTMSAIMSDGNPIDNLRIYLFDYVCPDQYPILPYKTRIAYLRKWHEGRANIYVLSPTAIREKEQIQRFLDSCLSQGFEGAILRKPNGTYKFGRSTAKEGLLIRIKPTTDSEAIIVGFKELEHNDNPISTSPTGKAVRSAKQSGKRKAGSLGGFLVQRLCGISKQPGTASDIRGDGKTFSVGNGPGLTQVLRQKIWNDREAYLGSIIRFSYLKHGTKPGGKPRMPKFLGFRDPLDFCTNAD